MLRLWAEGASRCPTAFEVQLPTVQQAVGCLVRAMSRPRACWRDAALSEDWTPHGRAGIVAASGGGDSSRPFIFLTLGFRSFLGPAGASSSGSALAEAELRASRTRPSRP